MSRLRERTGWAGRRGHRVLTVVTVVVVGSGLSGCSAVSGMFGGDDVEPYTVEYVNDAYPDREPASNDGSSPERLAVTALEPAHEVSPVGSVTGELVVRDQTDVTVPATLDVVGVHATDLSTVLRVRVSTADPVLPADDVWDTDRMGYYFDTVTVEVPDEMVLSPSFFRYAEGVFGKNCLCSELIGQVGPRGVTFYTYYGPLPEGTAQVSVGMVGFDPVLVPVEWAEDNR